MDVLAAPLALTHLSLRMAIGFTAPVLNKMHSVNKIATDNLENKDLHWTRDALVPLLVARVADGETGVPPGRRTRSGCSGAAIATNTTVFALPAKFGYVGDQRPNCVDAKTKRTR